MNYHQDISHFPSIDMTGQTMKQYRELNPKPILFDLTHKFSLSEEQINQLDYYYLKQIAGRQLRDLLDESRGMLELGGTPRQNGQKYVPIYQNCSRDHINYCALADTFLLSFRSHKDIGNIVLIQPGRGNVKFFCG